MAQSGQGAPTEEYEQLSENTWLLDMGFLTDLSEKPNNLILSYLNLIPEKSAAIRIWSLIFLVKSVIDIEFFGEVSD